MGEVCAPCAFDDHAGCRAELDVDLVRTGRLTLDAARLGCACLCDEVTRPPRAWHLRARRASDG